MGTTKGLKKYIETPEKLWEHFLSYKKWCKTTPRMQEHVLPRGGTQKLSLERPLTFESFEVWLNENKIISDLGSYESNRDGRYTDYVTIIARIKKHIRADQIEGGMVGQYNSNLTARINNITEKSDITSNGNELKGLTIKWGDNEIGV